jgi:hypothetical protein
MHAVTVLSPLPSVTQVGCWPLGSGLWSPGDQDRLEALSDGVFAIAITLVIELHPPELEPGDTLAHGLGAQWPSYLATWSVA